jgi:hypothetical protein
MNMVSAMQSLAVALLATVMLAGCGPKISPENFDKITKGMKEEQVTSILGIPSESRNSSVKVEGATFTSTQSKWRNDKGTIIVVFAGSEAGKSEVQDKQYFAPGTEPVPDRHR